MQDELTKSIMRFDWNSCERALDGRAEESVDDRCAHLEERIRESGRLLIPRPDSKRQKRRDEFVEKAHGYLASGADEHRQRFDHHVAAVRLVEKGFHAVLRAMDSGPNAHLSPAVHVWALIERIAQEDALMFSDMHAHFQRQPFLFDPYSAHVTAQGGHSYRPDAVTAAVIDVFSSSLLMFGYQNTWFLENGDLELPAAVVLPADAAFRAGLTLVFGQGWRLLDYSFERTRFFGGGVEQRPYETAGNDGQAASIDSVWFVNEPGDVALTCEFFDTIANERLARLFVQLLAEMSPVGSQKRVRNDATKLAPDQYLGLTEAHAIVGLRHGLHFDVVGDDTEYAGLTLREWVRGYALLIREAERAKPEKPWFTLSWTETELLSALRDVGLSEAAAGTFIARTTFGREHGDLFDAPLLRINDGTYHCLPHVLRVTNLPRVVLSHLSTLGVQIERKGKALEQETLALFRGQGLPAARLHFTDDGEEYECDCAVVWDKRLLLFECKNRTLSGERPARRWRFFNEVLGGVRQLARLKTAIEAHPERIKSALGRDVEWTEIVPCVLNGLPFSLPGQIDGTYVCDMSALARFFQSPTINLMSPVGTASGGVIVTRPLRRLWSGLRPTMDDLLAHLEEPLQVASLVGQYSAIEDAWPLSPDLAVVTTIIRMVPRSFEASIKAIAPDQDPTQVVAELRAASGAMRDGDGLKPNNAVTKDRA